MLTLFTNLADQNWNMVTSTTNAAAWALTPFSTILALVIGIIVVITTMFLIVGVFHV